MSSITTPPEGEERKQDTENEGLVEKPEDVQALQALSLYVRRLPVPLIANQLGLKRSRTYQLIKRGRQLVGLEAGEVVPDALLLADDLIRQAFIQLQEVDGMTDEKGKPLSGPTKHAVKRAIMAQINHFLLTKLKAVQAPQQKTQTGSVSKVDADQDATRIEIIRSNAKPMSELMKLINEDATQQSG